MKNTKNTAASKEVLFQKLGNTWYVFTDLGDDVIYSALPDGMDPRTTRMELFEVVEEHLKKVSMASAPKRKPEIAA